MRFVRPIKIYINKRPCKKRKNRVVSRQEDWPGGDTDRGQKGGGKVPIEMNRNTQKKGRVVSTLKIKIVKLEGNMIGGEARGE